MTESTSRTAEEVQAEFDAFKRKVRAVAFEAQQEEGWCESGMNAKLEKLGLPPKREFRVPVEITTVRTRWLTVNESEVESQEEANAWVNRERLEEAYTIGDGTFRVLEPGDPDEAQPDDLDFTYEVNGRPCAAWDPSHTYTCTRTTGHDGRLHISGDSETVKATWPNVPARPVALRTEEFNGELRKCIVAQPCIDGPGCNLCWTRADLGEVARNHDAIAAWEAEHSDVAWVTQTARGVLEPVDPNVKGNPHRQPSYGMADVGAFTRAVLRTGDLYNG